MSQKKIIGTLFCVLTFSFSMFLEAGPRERQILTDSLTVTLNSSTHRLADGTGVMAMVLKPRNLDVVFALVVVDKKGNKVSEFVSSNCEQASYEVKETSVRYSCVELGMRQSTLLNTYELKIKPDDLEMISDPKLTSSRAAPVLPSI